MPPAKKAAVKKAAVKKAAVKKAAVKKTNKKRALTLVTSYPTVSDYIAHEMEVWFRTIFIPQQEKNLKKLKHVKNHKINPYLAKYRSIALTGKVSPEGIARAMVVGTSLITGLNTSFGTQLQREITNILSGVNGSLTQGIDVEYVDHFDGRKKMAQIKAGPATINKDDIKTIIGHFNQARSLGNTNNVSVSVADQVVGVIYGKDSDLNDHYKKIQGAGYTVLVGDDFWEHMTGEKGLGTRLIAVCAAAIPSATLNPLLEQVVRDLAADPAIIDLAK
jgi:hypothetical protein